MSASIATVEKSLLDLIVREDEQSLDDFRELTTAQSALVCRKLQIVRDLQRAPYGTRDMVVRTAARTLNVSQGAVRHWKTVYERYGWRALKDGRVDQGKARAVLPALTRAWITDQILACQRADAVAEVHRLSLDQWNLWRRTDDPQFKIPGYERPPRDCGKGHPAGWSYENFRRCQPGQHARAAARQGPIASYRDLPSILSTRVGLKYLECVFFDDQKYDVRVRVPGYERPMVPMGFNSLDRLTSFAFQAHIRLRFYDLDEKRHKELTGREFVWYAITRLCTEGFRADEIGTTYVQEHGTAKAWANQLLRTPDGFHSFEEALRSITSRDGRPGVSLDSSGLFNKALFAELLYGPKSSGNPRFKAPIESFFHAVRTYSLGLIGQTGRNKDLAPEENYGIDKYERSIFRQARDLPDRLREGILSNYLTAVEFGHVVHLIYEGLNARTDHAFEGWDRCGHYEPVWRWAEDPEGVWHTRAELAALPEHIRQHALHQQDQDPSLTRLIPWSPAVAQAVHAQDPAIRRLKWADAIHLLPVEWAKDVKVRDRHTIHLTDDLLPGEELQYLPELTTPKGRKEYLQPGDQVRVYLNPLMPDEILVTDQEHRFIGTLMRNAPVGRTQDQLEAMFAHRARLKSALEAPVRRALQPVADRRAAVRDLNADLIEQARAAASPAPREEPARPARALPAADPLAASPGAATETRHPEDDSDPFV